MHAHMAPTARLDESLVLGQAGGGAFGAVAIGDAIRTVDADPDFCAGGRDHVERPVDGVG